MLGRILAVDAVDRRPWKNIASRRSWTRNAELEKKGLDGEELDEALARQTADRTALAMRRPFLSANDRSRWATVRALVEPDMHVPGAPYAIDRVIQQPELGHHRHGQARRPLLFQQAAAAVHAHGRRVLGHLPTDRQVAGHAPLRNRPLHAGHVQRDSAADLLPAPGRGWSSGWERPTGAGFSSWPRPSSAPS